MSAQEKISAIRDLIRTCYGVIASKGGSVPDAAERTLTNLPASIDSLSGERIKVSSVIVDHNCIRDGRWIGENSFDTSTWTSMESMFSSVYELEYLECSNWDLSNVRNIYSAFKTCVHLKELKGLSFGSKIVSLDYTFSDLRELKELDLSLCDTSNVSSFKVTFWQSYGIEKLNLLNWDLSKASIVDRVFAECTNLQSLIGDTTLDDVLANNIQVLKGLKLSISLADTVLERASLRAVINGIADLSSGTKQTLTLGDALKAKLTEEDISIATSKNWDIV